MVALDELIEAIEANVKRNQAILGRAKQIKRQREKGRSYREIVATENRPLIVKLLSDNFTNLTVAGTRFRKAEARALHSEGVTMEGIAELFGVTRQRVSALLSSKNGTGSSASTRTSSKSR